MGADIIQAQYEQLEALARNFGKQAGDAGRAAETHTGSGRTAAKHWLGGPWLRGLLIPRWMPGCSQP